MGGSFCEKRSLYQYSALALRLAPVVRIFRPFSFRDRLRLFIFFHGRSGHIERREMLVRLMDNESIKCKEGIEHIDNLVRQAQA